MNKSKEIRERGAILLEIVTLRSRVEDNIEREARGEIIRHPVVIAKNGNMVTAIVVAAKRGSAPDRHHGGNIVAMKGEETTMIEALEGRGGHVALPPRGLIPAPDQEPERRRAQEDTSPSLQFGSMEEKLRKNDMQLRTLISQTKIRTPWKISLDLCRRRLPGSNDAGVAFSLLQAEHLWMRISPTITIPPSM
jgi:hypothetical protein